MSCSTRTRMVLAIVLLLASLSLALPPASAAPTVVTWTLTNEAHNANVNFFVMDAAAEGVGTAGTISLAQGKTWIANLPATTDITVTGTWQIQVDLSVVTAALAGDETVIAEIGSWQPGLTGFDSQGIATIGQDTGTADFGATSVEIDAGQYMAMRIRPATGEVNLNVVPSDQPSGSRLSTPEAEPNYPVPELASLVLLGAGLVVIAGVVYVKRKRD